MKQTPLNTWHKTHGGRMVELGGWEMPVEYSGVMDEHRTVRTKVGLFDISHMGEIFVEGPDAKNFINHITTNNIDKISDGRCQYSTVCYENGGIVDDVISYQFSPQKYLVVVNASNTEKDFEWFTKNKKGNVTITNRSPEYCQLALQGPLAEKVLQGVMSVGATGRSPVQRQSSDLRPFHFVETELAGKKVILSRTGYTGEDGFEIYGNWDDASFLWETLLNAGKDDGIKPIGLAARDTLRLEAALSLYGHEINSDINPLEANLSWVVALDKPSFIGKEALQKIKQNGVSRKLIGLEMTEAGIPRQGYPILKDGKKIGEITSGTFSPTLEKPIGMALVEKNAADLGDEFEVQIRKNVKKARKVKLPFY